MSIQQALQKEIGDSKRWLDIEKMILHISEIFKKGLN
jgi:hypothetical protein